MRVDSTSIPNQLEDIFFKSQDVGRKITRHALRKTSGFFPLKNLRNSSKHFSVVLIFYYS